MATYDSHSAAGRCPLAQPHGIWGAACTGVSHTIFAPGHIAAGRRTGAWPDDRLAAEVIFVKRRSSYDSRV